jgi:hypothetical protein
MSVAWASPCADRSAAVVAVAVCWDSSSTGPSPFEALLARCLQQPLRVSHIDRCKNTTQQSAVSLVPILNHSISRSRSRTANTTTAPPHEPSQRTLEVTEYHDTKPVRHDDSRGVPRCRCPPISEARCTSSPPEVALFLSILSIHTSHFHV